VIPAYVGQQQDEEVFAGGWLHSGIWGLSMSRG
jgi:fatty-acyl-CoA synthase